MAHFTAGSGWLRSGTDYPESVQNPVIHLAMSIDSGVDIANNSREAVEMVGGNSYQLVLMDMQMPELDGQEATRRIRQIPGCEHLIIVAMTANAFAEDREACLAAGMDDFVPKPVDPDMLFATLHRWLTRPEEG